MTEIQNIGALVAQVGGAAGLGAFLYLLFRTKSLHPLRHLVWRAIYGQEVPSDPKVAKHVAEQTSLMSFRHSAGIDAETIGQAHRYIDWAETLDVPLRKIRAAIKYVDPQNMHIKVDAIAAFRRRAWFSGLCLSYVCLVLAVGMAFSQLAIYRVKATGTFFGVTSSAVLVWTDGVLPQTVSHAHCSGVDSPVAWTRPDRDAICDLINSQQFAETLQRGVEDLRVVSAMLILLFGWLFYIGLVEMNAYNNAKEILKRSICPGALGVTPQANEPTEAEPAADKLGSST